MPEAARRCSYSVSPLRVVICKLDLHGHANHRDIGNGRMLQEKSLQLGRRHLVAFDLDQFLHQISMRPWRIGGPGAVVCTVRTFFRSTT